MIAITVFTKSGGPLTKHIRLGEDGSVKSDGSACVMGRGQARRVLVAGIDEFAAIIGGLRFDQAIALGQLRSDLPDEVAVVTKDKLNGSVGPNVIARTAKDIPYQVGRPALVLLERAC